jgi:hypothetical protein
VGIDEAEALAVGNVLPEHGFKQGGFTCACLTDDEGVEEAVGEGYAETAFSRSTLRSTQ